ncbi:MAG: 4Fe-4S binding protein [Spirochaetaceae bacterium]|nr:4Fe-4S binding protein [Spirochaetaceae bacterium]
MIFLLTILAGLVLVYFFLFIFPSKSVDKEIAYSGKEIFSKNDLDIVYTESSAHATNMKAVVKCSPQRSVAAKGFTYADVKDCRLFKNVYESESKCRWGCIGFGSCVPVCPQEAIVIESHTAVITSSCIGCGKCVDSCPNGLIELIPKDAAYYIACAAHGGDMMKPVCSNGCTGCGKCNTSESDAFSVKNALAKINYRKDLQAGAKASAACPAKCIVECVKKEKNSFKFWNLCYRMLHNGKSDD